MDTNSVSNVPASIQLVGPDICYLVTSGGSLLFLFKRAVAMTLPSGLAHYACNQSLILRTIHLLIKAFRQDNLNVCV